MLLRARRNKIRIWKTTMAFVSTGVVVFGVYVFLTLQKPAFLTPLAKNNKSFSAESDQTSYLEGILTASHVSFASISQLKDLSFEVDLPNGISVFITPKKDLSFQASSLQKILKQLTIEGKEVKSIDFRFDRPVIAFK